MNKKTILLFLFLSLGITGTAEPVMRERATVVAESFFAQLAAGTKANEQCRLVWTFPDSSTKAESSCPLIYAFERSSGGFVLVSGEDAVRPILAYSFEDFFPVAEMPENMQSLLAWYADIIQHARVNGWDASTATREEWNSERVMAYTKASEGKELETARWGQGDPYNDLCPTDYNGYHYLTGCVATALAIVMRYHQWPVHGYGHLDSYSYSGKTIEGYDLGHRYDWNNMPLQYPEGGYTETQSQEIARFFYDVCVMCNIKFASGGSPGGFPPSFNDLCEHFGYDNRMAWMNRAWFEDEEWESAVKKEIDALCPVLYGGNDNSEGHAFVIDGYNDRYFRINYGWNGSSNGYYTLTPIDGHRNDLLRYYQYQDMVAGLKPNKDNTSASIFTNGFCNLTWDFSDGSSFSLTPGPVHNYRTDGQMDLCYILYDKQWNMKEIISEIKHIDCPYGSSVDIELQCKISKPVADGDRIVLATASPYDSSFNPFSLNRQSQIIFLKRPLKDLVSIGSSIEKSGPVFFMKTYKDISWQIVSRTNPSWDCSRVPQGIAYDETCLSCYSSDTYYDFNPDTVIRWFELPKGTYLLKLKNFDEEATIEIKM